MIIIPFPQADSPLIYPLLQADDLTLIELFQNHPERGKYLVTIFCRYGQRVMENLREFVPEENVVLASFSIWKDITNSLVNFNKKNLSTQEKESLYIWLLEFVDETLNQKKLKLFHSHNHLELDLFPLYFYTEIALNLLSPQERLIIVTKDKFNWQNSQIIDYLASKGEIIDEDKIQSIYDYSHEQILNFIPSDIRLIYLNN